MNHHTPDLNDLIGSRICHDLISPLGAISNGLELLAMTTKLEGPEVALITDSVDNANARIRFFRIAFGAASEGQMSGEAEVRSLLADMVRGGRVSLDWQAGGDQPRQIVKLVFLLIQCFETAMPWGGKITIASNASEWLIQGTGDRLQVDPDIWQVLARPADGAGLDAAKVHFALAPIAAAAIGRRLIFESTETTAKVRF